MFFRIGRSFREFKCVLPQSNKYQVQSKSQNERMSLCISKRGSLTVEAAMIMPFFLSALLALFSFFLQHASAAELSVKTAAEAKKVAIAAAVAGKIEGEDVRIYKTKELQQTFGGAFIRHQRITQGAVCRAWIGFTQLEANEVYVYETPNAEVYHLYRDCTHLELSIQRVSFERAKASQNMYGETYRECEHCKGPFHTSVYITLEGNCYHSQRSCSGLKRTIRQVPLSSVESRGCCIRCMERGT